MKVKRILAVSLLTICCTAFSQTFPDKTRPIRLVVPFGAGSGTDLIARAYGKAMAEQHGVNVVIDNKPGAEGVIGVEAVKNAPADGYTFLIANTSTHVLNVHMLQKIPYDPIADFMPVATVAKFALVLNAGPSTKFNRRATPLKPRARTPESTATAAAPPRRAWGWNCWRTWRRSTCSPSPTSQWPKPQQRLRQRGRLPDQRRCDRSTALPDRASASPLGSTGRERLAALPAVPTLREQGVEGYELSGWFAMFVPVNTPPAVAASLRKMLREAAGIQGGFRRAGSELLRAAGQGAGAVVCDASYGYRTLGILLRP